MALPRPFVQEPAKIKPTKVPAPPVLPKDKAARVDLERAFKDYPEDYDLTKAAGILRGAGYSSLYLREMPLPAESAPQQGPAQAPVPDIARTTPEAVGAELSSPELGQGGRLTRAFVSKQDEAALLAIPKRLPKGLSGGARTAAILGAGYMAGKLPYDPVAKALSKLGGDGRAQVVAAIKEWDGGRSASRNLERMTDLVVRSLDNPAAKAAYDWASSFANAEEMTFLAVVKGMAQAKVIGDTYRYPTAGDPFGMPTITSALERVRQGPAGGANPWLSRARIPNQDMPLPEKERQLAAALAVMVDGRAEELGVDSAVVRSWPISYGDGEQLLEQTRATYHRILQRTAMTEANEVAVVSAEVLEEYTTAFIDVLKKIRTGPYEDLLRKSRAVGLPVAVAMLAKEQAEAGGVEWANIDAAINILQGNKDGTITSAQDARGKVSVIGWILDKLGRPSMFVGSTIHAMLYDIQPQAFATPHGYFLDYVDAAHYMAYHLEHTEGARNERDPRIMRGKFLGHARGLEVAIERGAETPGEFIGLGLASVAALGERARGQLFEGWWDAPEGGVFYARPVILTFPERDPKDISVALAEGWHGTVSGEGMWIADAVYRTMVAGADPDDWVTKASAIMMGLAGEFMLDPLMWIGSGKIRTKGLQKEMKKTLKGSAKTMRQQLAGEAPLIGKELEVRGLKSLEAVDEGLETVMRPRKGRLGQTKAKPNIVHTVKLPNERKTLAGWAAAKYQVLKQVFNGSDELAGQLIKLAKGDPHFLNGGWFTWLQAEENRNKLFSWFSRAGIEVRNADDAAALMSQLAPTLNKVMALETSIPFLSKYHGAVRGFGSANDLMRWSRQFEHAGGIYIGKFGTPLATDWVFADLEAKIGLMGRGLEKLKGFPGLGAPITAAQNAVLGTMRYAASKIHYDSFRYIGIGGGKVVRLEPEMADALRFRATGTGALANSLEKMTASALVRKVPTAVGRVYEGLPMGVQRTLAFILDGGATLKEGVLEFTPITKAADIDSRVGYALLVNRAKEFGIERLRKMSPEQQNKAIASLAKKITPKHIKNHKAWLEANGYMQNLDEAAGAFQTMGGMLKQAGLVEPELLYIPHLFPGLDKVNDLPNLTLSSWQKFLSRRRGVMMETRGSPFNWRREGPPTLLEAMIMFGEEGVVQELSSLMRYRIGAGLIDYHRAMLIREVGEKVGVTPTIGRNAIKRMTDDRMIQGRSMDEWITGTEEQFKDFPARLKDLRVVQQRIARNKRKIEKAGGLDGPWPSSEMSENLTQQAAHREAAAQFADEFGLARQDVVSYMENGATSSRLRGSIRHLENIIKKEGTPAARREIAEATMPQLKEALQEYDKASDLLDAAKLTGAQRAALLQSLYDVPAIEFLSRRQLRDFVERGEVRLGDIVRNEDGVLFFERPYEAIKKWKEDKSARDRIFTKFTRGEENALGQALADTYIPVEIALALRAKGLDIGTNLESVAGIPVLRSIEKGVRGFALGMRLFNQPMKAGYTVFMPSLSFGRRNQVDMWGKMYLHSGAYAFSPWARKEFRDIVRGKVKTIKQETGGVVQVEDLMRELDLHMFQSYERRLDMEALVRDADTLEGLETTAEAATRKSVRAMEAMDPSHARGLEIGFASTGGRPPRLAEQLVPYGPGATEVFDNWTRLWIAVQEVRAGRSARDAMKVAFDYGRNYMNVSEFERWFVSNIPVFFYNFYKQNTIAVLKGLHEHPFRTTWWDKFRRTVEADMPENLRPDWGAAMDFMLGKDGYRFFALDAAAMGVFDSVATLALGKEGLGSNVAFAWEELLDGAPPPIQMILGSRGARTSAGRIRLSGATAARIHGGKDRLISYGGIPVMETYTEGGEPVVDYTDLGALLAFMSTAGSMQNALERGARRTELSPGLLTFIEMAGGPRTYDYQLGLERFIKGVNPEVVKRIADASWRLGSNRFGILTLKGDYDPDLHQALKELERSSSAMAGVISRVREMLNAVRQDNSMPMGAAK